MKRIKNLVIGGIENKVFNLILVTVILLTAAYMAVSVNHSNMLAKLAAESNAQQQAAIEEITNATMYTVVEQSMGQSTELEAHIADGLFDGLKTRVEMMGEYAQMLFSDPSAYSRMAFAGPDPAQNGETVAQLILADGVDGTDPELADRIGLAANMSGLMVSLYGVSAETNSCFIALPDGVFLVTDDRSATKFDESGAPISYDPRTRPWYQLAVEKGELAFTDVEIDAFTGDIGVVCAMPIYVDGELAAVVGSDLFLTSMQEGVQSSDSYGSYVCIINQNGHVVFSPRTEGEFRVVPASEAEDLRQSDNEALAAVVSDALREKTDLRTVDLSDGAAYVVGAPIGTMGWTLISVCSVEAANQTSVALRDSYDQIQAASTATYREKTARSRQASIILLVVITLVMLGGALALGKRIVRPLNTITKRISELSEGNLEFKMEDAYRTGDEIEELAESFASISHKTVLYMDRVRKVTAEKERIGAELSLATDIQAAMLPHIVPAFPDRTDFDIIGSMDPAKEVGGDFYDYFLIDDDHLCMVIADVSGKGVPAALFMMASKIILQSVAMLGRSPAEILAKTNEAICSNNEAQMFVTVWLGILELSTGKLTAANAGHEYPVFKRPDGSFELFKDKHGFVIGGLEGARYREYEVQMEPGSKLFVYTDGVPEATNAAKELFGTQRMLDALNAAPDITPQQVLKNVRQAVDGFVRDAEQFDDLTMLCMEYKGPDAKGGEEK
ncbi:MAG: SpoIIE family protein phosphatase [Clostridia bacterium]|nr:SpoIIE family protein phosphatase [Clostridia bacterium]